VSKRHVRLGPIVVDKNIAGDVLGPMLGRRPVNATTTRPTRAYRGKHADDEDFAHVLQLGWENEVAVLSADGKMIEKALKFEKQFPKEESCLRGVVVLPPGNDAQIRALQRLLDGSSWTVPTDMDPKREPLDLIEDFNLGVDLRKDVAKVVYLCDCEG
jgi:hypothetical protein